MSDSSDEIRVPESQDGSEESHWWDANPDLIMKKFQKAEAEGRLGHRTAIKQAAARQPAAQNSAWSTAVSTTIRLDPADVSLARIQAEREGLRYQTYLKMLLHEALLEHSTDM